VDAAELSFPLVPRWRPVGSAFGRLRAARRGIGSSVAGTRAYRPGDDPSLIDWKLSARLSSLRGEADFVVREDFADEAPRLVVLADRSPSMALYPDDLPWLSKPRALEAVWRAVATTAVRELGLAGYLDTAAGESWFSPRSAVGFDVVAERQSAATASRTVSSSRSSGWPGPGGRCRPDRSYSSAPTSSGHCAPRSGCGRSASAGISSPSSSRTPSGSRASHRSAG
jgi:hypothetical protein